MDVWKRLEAHHERHRDRPIAGLFEADNGRAEEFSASLDGMVLDYSKTGIDIEARALLLALAEDAQLVQRREALFTGARVNETEGRAALHTALRNPDAKVLLDGEDIAPGVRTTLERMEAFAHGVRNARIRAPGGRITDVVNIGIGGSDLGPAMAVQALAPFHDGPRCHFVSNVDGAHIHDVLDGLDPRTTMVVVVSKTFTTRETMLNAETARAWLAPAVETPSSQFAAVSAATERTAAFGIDPSRVFGFADWVGGRYSLWGPVGLSLMIAIGPERFRAFLAGGAAMDAHFRAAPLAGNLPVMLALVGIWHNQIAGHATRAVLPYDQRLARLPAYLQQLEMESNGKRVAMDGAALTRHSGPVVWGEPGTNGQHAFMQLVHQGTRVVPCEFLVAASGHEPALDHHHRHLLANCLAQSEALMRGRSLDEARTLVAGPSAAARERAARHRVFPGNRPSTTLIYPALTPDTLGRIIALYEHRVFTEGVILGINSFDQWGVELGKALADDLLPALEGGTAPENASPSTKALIERVRRMRCSSGARGPS